MAKRISSNIIMDGYLEGYTGQPRVVFVHYTSEETELWFKYYDIGKDARKKEQMLELLITGEECNE